MKSLSLFERVGYPSVSRRLAWLDAVKCLSAFAVVMTHIASITWQAVDPSSSSWLVASVYEIVTRFAVPCFFMTSGALLLNPNKRLSTGRLVRRYVLPTAILALTVSVLFCLFQQVLVGQLSISNLVRAALDGPYFIWYLWVLVALYAMTPALRALVKDDRALTNMVGCLFVLVLGRSTLDTMAPGSTLTAFADNFIVFSRGSEGLLYYLLGAWLVSNRPVKAVRWGLYASGVAALVLAIVLNAMSARAIGPDLYYVGRDNVLIALFAVALFELVRSMVGDATTPLLLGLLTSWGMGIYLIHPFIRLAMESLGCTAPAVSWLLGAPALAIPAVSVAIWAISAILAALLFCLRSALRGLIRPSCR